MQPHPVPPSAPAGRRLARVVLSAMLAVVGVLVAQTPVRAAPDPAPGISYRSSSSASAPTATTSLTFTTPAGTTTGDLLVARIAQRDNVSSTVSAPAGWVALPATASAGLLKVSVFTRVVAAGDPGSVTFTNSAAVRMVGTVSSFGGVDPLAPVDQFKGKVNGNSASLTGEPVTTTAGNEYAVWLGSQLSTTTTCPASSITPPAGFTEPVDGCLPASNGLSYDVAYRQLGAPAAQPAFSGSSAAANTNIVQVLTLRPAGAPIVHHGSTAGTVEGSGSLAISRPSGTLAGDVLLARVITRNNVSATMTPPAGWASVRVDQSTYSVKSWIFSRVTGGNEPASYTFTSSATTASGGTISAYGGVDTARPIDTSSGAYVGNSTSFTAPAITTGSNVSTAVWFGSTSSTTTTCPASTITPPAGFAERIDSCLPHASHGLSYDVADLRLGVAGAQPTWTGTSATASGNITQVVALRAATAAQVADTYSATPVTVGSFNVPLSQLNQPSGLAASQTNPGVLYTESEKADGTLVGIRSGDASVVGTWSLAIPDLYDLEDIATGPCPTGSCLYAGDVGGSRNDLSKPTNVYSVTRITEPDIAAGQTNGTLTGDQFRYTYPGGVKYNAESLMVDPRTADIYVITKDSTGAGLSRVFAFPKPLPAPGSTSVLTQVATLQLPTTSDVNFAQVTAAAVHPAGNRFIVRTYRAVYEYRGTPGGSLSSAFTGTRVSLTDTAEGQGEAIEYATDGSAYFTLSEKTAAPYTLKRVDRS